METREDIIKYLQSLPNKFKIQTKYGNYPKKVYEDGLSTAMNYNPITKFYLDYLRGMKKTTTLMPVPGRMDPRPYNILNDILKAVPNIPIPEIKQNYGDDHLLTDERWIEIRHHGVENRCYQLMSGLLYEDYFNLDFRYARFHNEVMKLFIPKSEEDIKKLYDIFMDKDGTIYPPLFFADTIPIVRLLEK